MGKESILILNNNFYGSYCSNQYFYNEICRSLEILGKRYTIVNSIKDAIKVFENDDVSFSLCLGKYEYYVDSIPLYDKYGVLNYQWISDDPMKFNIDHNSKLIRYIFIDHQFPQMAGRLMHQPLILPLGYLPEKEQSADTQKVNGILFPGQIRCLNSIEVEIEHSGIKNEIIDFLDAYDLDSSYITAYRITEKKISESYKREFFRLTNSYTRTLKRLKAVDSISSMPVFIAGDKTDNYYGNADVRFIGKYDYSQIETVMNSYRYLLNVDPNYHSCIHERVSRGINAGALVFSNESETVNRMKGFPCVYRFDGTLTINSILSNNDFCFSEIFKQERYFIRDTSWIRSLERIINDYRIYQKGVSLYDLGV